MATVKDAVETLLKEEKYNVLREFASIYGIGPETAQMFYNNKCRTLGDVKNFCENPENAPKQEDSHGSVWFCRIHHPRLQSWIGVSLSLKDDLSIR